MKIERGQRDKWGNRRVQAVLNICGLREGFGQVHSYRQNLFWRLLPFLMGCYNITVYINRLSSGALHTYIAIIDGAIATCPT